MRLWSIVESSALWRCPRLPDSSLKCITRCHQDTQEGGVEGVDSVVGRRGEVVSEQKTVTVSTHNFVRFGMKRNQACDVDANSLVTRFFVVVPEHFVL